MGIITPSEYLSYASAIYPEWVTRKKENLFALPGAFDTEFTSMYATVNGERIKMSIMYAWMFGMGEPDSPVCLGRTWPEFVDFVHQLQNILQLNQFNRQLVYVHNLSAEFQFMHKWFDWDKVFVMESHRPVYAITNGIEFRCSLKLSGGRGLAAIGENLSDERFRKLTGDLDYSKLRIPITPLTTTEQGYCENDVRVLLAYIKEKIQQDGSIWNIPLTNTGYVRNHIREKCLSVKSYRDMIKRLTLTPEVYEICHAAFRGGDTHANPSFVEVKMGDGTMRPNHNLHPDGSIDDVHSQDLTSSYPAVMVLEKFPMSAPTIHPEVKTLGELSEVLKGNRGVFKLIMHYVEPSYHFHHLIPASRCTALVNAVEDNGRVVTADYMELPTTDVELEYILRFYHAATIEVSSVVTWSAKYLPTPFVRAILELYNNKTTLKGVAGQEREYVISKNMMNSSYGMVVTNIIRDIFQYDNDMGYLPKQTPNLAEEIDKYNKKPRRFLYYPWGIFVTAFARCNLWKAIEELKDDFVYCDTDSTKYINHERHLAFFERYNRECTEKAHRASAYHRIPIGMFAPVNKAGHSYFIGLWEYEGSYTKFKTLGAKRYLVEVDQKKYEKLKDDYPNLEGPYLLTCAGLNKEKGSNFLIRTGAPFENFTLEMSVPANMAGRLVHTYLDYPAQGVITDYLGNQGEVYEKSMLHLEPAAYEMHEMARFVNYLRTMPLGSDIVM